MLLPGYTMLASVLVTLALSSIFYILYRQGREHFMLMWLMSWLSYAAMFIVDLLNFNAAMPAESYLMFRHMAALTGSYLFLTGTAEFLDYRLPRAVLPIYILSILSSILYPAVPGLMDILLLPNIVILSMMIIVSGCIFLSKSWTRNVPERTLAGIIILIWSIFINHFSFTYTVRALALFSYFVGLIMVNVLIVTIMIIYFRKVRFLDNKNSERFRLLVENSSDVMFLYDYHTGQFEYVSDSIAPLIGVSAEHLYEIPDCFFDNVGIEEDSGRLRHIFDGPVYESGSGILTMSNGGTIEKWSRIHYIPITDSTGAVTAIEGILRDISQQKRASLEIASAENAKKEFLQDISHEIKTPITIINGYTETLMNNLLPPEASSTYIKLIHSKAQILNNLIDDLAAVSDFSSQTIEYKFYEVNAEEFFTRVIDEARVFISESRYQVETVCHVDPSAVAIADSTRISQVVSNLVNNAIRHTPEGRLISLRCESFRHEQMMHLTDDASSDDIPMGDIVFSVRDTGSGIPQDDLPYIFERNYSGRNRQVDAETKITGRKTGLGLFISRQIISQHSGTITAANHPDGGAVFTFRLPYYL